MSWQPKERWRNETMMLGPHRFLATLQMEINQLGREDEPWSLHGWELTPLGWVGCVVRSTQVDPDEPATIKAR